MANLGTFDPTGWGQKSKYSKLQPGWYKVKVAGATRNDDKKRLEFDLEIVAGPEKSKAIPLFVWWEKGGWVLRDLLTALGMKVPDRAFRLDSDKITGKGLWVQTELEPDKNDPDKEYTRIIRMEPTNFVPQAPATASPGTKKPAPVNTNDEGIEELGEDDLG